MIIDKETFTDLALHLKLASASVLKTARLLGSIQLNDDTCLEIVDALVVVNVQVTEMQRLLEALLRANKAEGVVQ